MIGKLWMRVALLFLTAGFAATAEAEVKNVSNQEVMALMQKGVPIIDIRTEPEWRQTGIVPGSHLLTFFDATGRVPDPAGWLHRVKAVAPPEKPVILICRTGNRTTHATRFLSESGYKTVYNVTTGIVPWIKEGMPVAPWPQR